MLALPHETRQRFESPICSSMRFNRQVEAFWNLYNEQNKLVND
jgi:hypothetical protein